jgi:pimeloyl-ACP methyl ester carboxylesterase
MVAEMFGVRHPDKVAGLILLDPTESTAPRFLYDTLSSRVLLPVELALNALWFRVIGLFMTLNLPRPRIGRAVVRRTAAKDLSHDKLERIYGYTDNHPRAILETAQMLRLVIPYLRETKAALKSATLPDVPTRIISPQPRPKWAAPTRTGRCRAPRLRSAIPQRSIRSRARSHPPMATLRATRRRH